MSSAVRVDKWLWAARFFKTRSLAATAVNTGKVEIEGSRPKPSRGLRVGDLLTVRRGPYEYEIEVLALSEKRGPAKMAQTLYEETEESVARRAEVAKTLQAERAQRPLYDGSGRPTKKDRRQLMKLVGRSIAGPRGRKGKG